MGNYINDINYTPNSVTGTDKLSTGHADVHNDDQVVISELVDNQAILDDALATQVDSSLPDRVDTLEEIVHILAQGLEATFFSIGDTGTADGELFPKGADGNLASTWADVTEIKFSDVTESHGTMNSRPFHVSSLLVDEVIRLTEADASATINPVNGYMIGSVKEIFPDTNSVSVVVSYSVGNPVAGEFVVAELFPPQEDVDLSEYATMAWSNSQFSLIDHTHNYANSTHTHSYAASDHDHDGYWTAVDATHNKKGIGKLGQLSLASSSGGMVVGQLYYNNGTIMYRVS